MTFHSVGNVIIPTDVRSSIFQRGRLNHQPDINITGDSDISYPESNYLFAKIEEVNGKSTRKPYVWLTKWFQPQILDTHPSNLGGGQVRAFDSQLAKLLGDPRKPKTGEAGGWEGRVVYELVN